MSRRTARVEPDSEERLAVLLTDCAVCGETMPAVYTKARKLMTLRGLVKLRLQIRRCENQQCSRFHQVYHPEAEGHWALPEREFAHDVVQRVGQLRYREHRSCPEIHLQLQQEGVTLSKPTVFNLLAQYDTLLSLALDTVPERAARPLCQARCRVI